MRGAIVACVVAIGCAGATPPAKPVAPPGEPPPLPHVEGAPPLWVTGGGEVPEVASAFAIALARAGYTRATSAGPGVLDLRVTVSAAPVPGGETAYGVAVSIFAGRERVDEARISFLSEPKRVSAETLRPLLAALVEHGKLEAHVDARAAAERQKLAAIAARQEDAWRAARPDDCRATATDETCDPLVRWLRANADDARVPRARAILDETEPRRAALREEKAWAEADVARCRAPKTSDDCLGALAYLQRFPTGPHAREAEEAVDRSLPARQVLARREEQARITRRRTECQTFCRRDRDTLISYREDCRKSAPSAVEACMLTSCVGVCLADPER